MNPRVPLKETIRDLTNPGFGPLNLLSTSKFFWVILLDTQDAPFGKKPEGQPPKNAQPKQLFATKQREARVGHKPERNPSGCKAKRSSALADSSCPSHSKIQARAGPGRGGGLKNPTHGLRSMCFHINSYARKPQRTTFTKLFVGGVALRSAANHFGYKPEETSLGYKQQLPFAGTKKMGAVSRCEPKRKHIQYKSKGTSCLDTHTHRLIGNHLGYAANGITSLTFDATSSRIGGVICASKETKATLSICRGFLSDVPKQFGSRVDKPAFKRVNERNGSYHTALGAVRSVTQRLPSNAV